AGWAAESPTPTAWLSLSEADREAAHFWSGVIAALEGLSPGCGERARRALAGRTGLRAAVGQLLDDLDSVVRSPAVVVIDDAHLVDDDDHDAVSLALLALNLPAWLHLVMVSRRTPALPVHRL